MQPAAGVSGGDIIYVLLFFDFCGVCNAHVHTTP